MSGMKLIPDNPYPPDVFQDVAGKAAHNAYEQGKIDQLADDRDLLKTEIDKKIQELKDMEAGWASIYNEENIKVQNLQKELRARLKLIADTLDKLNGEYGTKETLCLICRSKSYGASGIIHKADCLIASLRKEAEGKKK